MNGASLLLALLVAVPPPPQDTARDNVARGKSVTFAPAPNYRLTLRGDTDSTDLTDGKLSAREDNKLWFDAAAVGYSYAGLVQLAVDLGEPVDVSEVAVRFQGGSPQAGICFPARVDIVMSMDGVRYYHAASLSKWNRRQWKSFAIPANDGKAWVHKLRWQRLNVTTRFVGLAFYGAGLSVTDEIEVIRGRSDDKYIRPEDGFDSDFTVTGPRLYFHKPELHVPTRINAPTPVGLILPPGFPKGQVSVSLDLPAGVRLVSGGIGGVDAKAAENRREGNWTRLVFPAAASRTTKTWGRLYFRADWPAGREGELRYQIRWKDGESPLMTVPVRAIRIGPAPRPKRLMTGLGWWSLGETMAWPEALEAFQTLGFNTLPLFARWTKLDQPDVQSTLKRFRAAGFRVLNIDSTFHHMLASAGERKKEMVCRFADGTVGERLCPSYRGELYRRELERVARECVTCRADQLSCDIELWSWRGPVDAPRCVRCQVHHKAGGVKDWAAWRLARGEEMWRDLAGAVRKACADAGAPAPELGVYDFRPGHNYQKTWPFDRLYPKWMGNSQVSTYTPLAPWHLELIGNEARADRERLPRSDVLPWITPGDAGTFPGEMFTWALLECFANGARGVHFWSGRVWDAETLAAYADAIRMAVPVEDVIVDGKLVSGVRTEPTLRVSGMRRGNEMFLLLARYADPLKGTVTVELPVAGRRVVDLATGETVATLAAGEKRFRIAFEGERAKALHVQPR